MTKRRAIDGIVVSFHEILDILVPKMWQNGGKFAQKITVFRKMKKAQSCNFPHFQKTRFSLVDTLV